jgi:hypothetical protein
MATKTAPKTAPKTRASRAAKSAPKTRAPKSSAAKTAPATASRGSSAETLAFAAKVVKLRDSGLAWAVVAERLGVSYETGYSSRLRRAYILGNGATVGVRKAATESAPSAKAKTTKATPKATAKKAPRETGTERRARLGRESASAAKTTPKKRTRRAA